MRAADALCAALKAEGVDHVFGIPGGANLPTYDALYDADLTHIQARHEQGAGHAAEGYAKASGRVGVALGDLRPRRDQPGHADRRRDDGLGADRLHHRPGAHRPDRHRRLPGGRRHGITLPVVKHSLLVQDPRQIPEYIHAAFHIASTGRPGPVLVDIPQDLSRADIDYSRPTGAPNLPGYKPPLEGNIKQIRSPLRRWPTPAPGHLRRRRDHQRQRLGASSASSARSDGFPVTCTLMGLGAFPAPHEQWLGMLGMHGTRAANYAMDEADLIVCRRRPLRRPDHRQALRVRAPRQVRAHRRRSGRDLARTSPAHIPIVGDAKDVLAKLNQEYRALEADSSRLDDWWKQIREWQSAYPLRYEDSSDSEIKPQFMVEAMYEATGGDAIITSDVGQHQMWAAQYYHFAKPRRWINSGGLGTMGFGLPAAIGAKVALPGRARSSASPATAAWSWSARRWRPPPHTTSRSRSS